MNSERLTPMLYPDALFAVVTELFFERPVELQKEYPALYDECRQYYRQDPAARLRECQT